MAQNEPQRKDTPLGPSPNSPSLLFEYQCRSGKFIRLANRIESKKIDSVARIESNRIETFLPELECSNGNDDDAGCSLITVGNNKHRVTVSGHCYQTACRQH